nr:hypothetical protein K-LCC10_0036 [Kaumoebavirus]
MAASMSASMLGGINVDNIVEMALRNQLVKYKLEKLNSKEIYKKNRKLFKEDLNILLKTYKTEVYMAEDETLMHWDQFVSEYCDFIKFVGSCRDKIFSTPLGYSDNLKQLSEKGKKIYGAWRYLKDQKMI